MPCVKRAVQQLKQTFEKPMCRRAKNTYIFRWDLGYGAGFNLFVASTLLPQRLVFASEELENEVAAIFFLPFSSDTVCPTTIPIFAVDEGC